MESTALVYFTFVSLAFFSLAFFYWKDSSEEGYSTTRIFDSYFSMITGGLIGGKVLFRPLSIDYFRYQVFESQFIIEGILLGGFLGLFIYLKYNRIDSWKVGDMLASALASFQFIIFLGIAIITRIPDYYVISVFFLVIFILLRYLRVVKNFGSSKKYFELKRYNKFILTGGLISIYLTALSVVAILFLVKNLNIGSGFWRFQIVFYLVILFSTYFSFRNMLVKGAKK